MKNKKEISDKNESDSDHNLPSSEPNINPDSKYIFNKYSKSKIFSEQKSVVNIVNEDIDLDEASLISLGEIQESENGSRIEKLPEETTSLKFSKIYSKEKSVTMNSIFNVKDLTPDDEIYLLQCPKNYTKYDSCNKNVDFMKFTESFNCNGEIYKLEFLNSEKKFITLAVPEKGTCGSLVKLPFKGHIIIQKEVNMVPNKPKNIDILDVHSIVFPKDIKVRHPLLGVEWKSHIELANKAINKKNFTETKSKKIKEKSQGELKAETKKLKRESSQSEVVYKNKKKKYDKAFQSFC